MKNLYFKSSNFSLLLLAFCFLLFTGMQCKKTSETTKEDVLPAETQTGKQTFGCLVNGEVWLPKGSFPYSGLTATIQFDIVSILARNSGNSIIIGIRNIKDESKYNLIPEDNEFNFNGVNFKCTDGFIEIKRYDKNQQIISGTFEANGKSNDGKIIRLTKGRFDLLYNN